MEVNAASLAGLPEAADSDADTGRGAGERTARSGCTTLKEAQGPLVSQRSAAAARQPLRSHALSGARPRVDGPRKGTGGWAFKRQNTCWASTAAGQPKARARGCRRAGRRSKLPKTQRRQASATRRPRARASSEEDTVPRTGAVWAKSPRQAPGQEVTAGSPGARPCACPEQGGARSPHSGPAQPGASPEARDSE